MKKILVVEDKNYFAEWITRAINDLGKITTITEVDGMMPTEQEVRNAINIHDIILLDDKLGTDYAGTALAKYARAAGKTVVGISSTTKLGEKNFFDKARLISPANDAKLSALVSEYCE